MGAKITDRKEKKCSRCANLLPMSEFTVTRSRPTGSSRCKVCMAEEAQQLRAARPELNKLATLRWQEANPELYASIQKANKVEFYARNSEVLKAAVRVWQAGHPELVRVYKKLNRQKRRARIKGQHVPAWVVAKLFELFEGKCAYCRSAPAVHMDHIYPLSKGGDHLPSNLAPACAHCNLSKNASLPVEFQDRTGYDVQAVIQKVRDLN